LRSYNLSWLDRVVLPNLRDPGSCVDAECCAALDRALVA